MKKLNHRLTKFIQNHWFGFYVVVMLAIPGIVNFLMNLAIPTLPELTAPTWLGFWGSYLGGAIGCLPALAAYRHSIEESRRQHKEFQEQLQESRRQSGEQYASTEKDRHAAHLPVIDYGITHIKSPADFSDVSLSSIRIVLVQLPNASGVSMEKLDIMEITGIIRNEQHDVVLLSIRNVGHGPALSVVLHCSSFSYPIRTLAENESCMILLCLNRTTSHAYHLEFSFSDMLGWNYRQSHDFLLGIEFPFPSPIQPPERVE
nr:hypothetical protein [uncultured Oscillibacter sp.]